jgi:glycosyltransferase involved in cell wall biosynthesis
MRVLMLADAGSAHTLKWVRSLSEKGCSIQLVSLYSAVEPGIAELVKNGDIALHLGEADYAGSFVSSSFLRRVGLVRKLIKRWKPDVVHAHYASSYGLLGALSGHPRLAVSVWGSDVFDFPHRNRVFAAVLRFNLRRAQAIFSTSKAMASELQGYTKKPIVVIPFGVDVLDFDRGVREKPGVPFVFGTVKTLSPVYGIDLLIRAFAQVRDRVGGDRVRLAICGKGPQQAELTALVDELGLSHQVQFLGPVSHREVPRVLSNMDVFCALSRQESFGVAVVEAMASRLPVVVSDAPGPKEIVAQGVEGVVVPRDDVDAAAEAMISLMNDAVWREMSSRAHAKVVSHYHWPNQVDEQIRQYALMTR